MFQRVFTAAALAAVAGLLALAGFPNPYGTTPLPYTPCGYTPQQIKGAYGLANAGYDGSGQSVAIIDAYASPTIQQDLDQWSANRGLPSTTVTQIVAPGTYNHPEAGLTQDPQGWYGEETLDVEAVHGMAPAGGHGHGSPLEMSAVWAVHPEGVHPQAGEDNSVAPRPQVRYQEPA